MKKSLLLTLVLAMILAATACSKPAEETKAPETTAASTETAAETAAAGAVTAEEVRGVTVPAFEITVNGLTVTNELMAEYPVYSCECTSTNSKGTETTSVFQGFALKDICAAAGLTEEYVWVCAEASDGYAVEITENVMDNTTMLAVTKDGSQFSEAPWFAPCTSDTTGNFVKGCVKLLVNTTPEAPAITEPAKDNGGEDAPAAGAPEARDVTEKVTFADYAFKVNGEEVTNETLAGLSIYKVTVTTTNSKGESSEDTYCGYKLADVLVACGLDAQAVKAVADDGYENALTPEQVTSDLTIVAIEKNKELGENGTIWLAPCDETSSKVYAKNVIEIVAE